METAKPIGALLPGIADQPASTALQPPSMTSLASLDLASLPRRLDDQTLALVRELANSPLPVQQHCDDDTFARCMKSMDILPRKQDDALGGKLKVGIYRRHLSGFSNEAMIYLASEATKTCHWFPTVAECLDILRAWPNREVATSRREKAVTLVRWEMQARMDEWIARLADKAMCQAEIDEAPERWRMVAEARGYLFVCGDGSHLLRPGRPLTEDERTEALIRGGIRGLVAPEGDGERKDEAA